MNKITIGIVVAVVVLGSLVWLARPSSPDDTAPVATREQGTLTVAGTANHDFGTISMAAGEVKHRFTIKNADDKAVSIKKMYTSCMCTTATLLAGEKQFGPYGMPGHGIIPKINQSINPGEEAVVEITFDPAAHGPAGIGRIQRTITIENNAGQPVELWFVAVVTP